MKICPNCQIEFDDRFILCNQCGSKLQKQPDCKLRNKLVAAASLTKEELDAGIRKGYDDMLAGKSRPAEEVFDDLRKKYNL